MPTEKLGKSSQGEITRRESGTILVERGHPKRTRDGFEVVFGKRRQRRIEPGFVAGRRKGGDAAASHTTLGALGRGVEVGYRFHEGRGGERGMGRSEEGQQERG